MKFELVEFYPAPKDNQRKKFVGTVHIYAIDCELDIRGIVANIHSGKIFFHFPHFRAIDEETKAEVSYPFIHWTNVATQKEMMDFLHQQVKPEIMKRLNLPKREV